MNMNRYRVLTGKEIAGLKFERGTIPFHKVGIGEIVQFEDGSVYRKMAQESVEICGFGCAIPVHQEIGPEHAVNNAYLVHLLERLSESWLTGYRSILE